MEKHKKLAVTEGGEVHQYCRSVCISGRSLEMVSSVHFAVWRMFLVYLL